MKAMLSWLNVHYPPSHCLLLTGVTITVEVPRIIVSESDGFVEVCARLTNGVTLGRRVTFNLSTEDNDATSESHRDFTFISHALQLDMNLSRNCAHVIIDDDSIVENAESFRVVVSSSDPQVDIRNSTTIVTIEDNDEVAVGFEMDQYRGEEGQMTMVCAIVKGSVSLDRPVLVQLSTRDSTASGLFYNMWGYHTRL